VGRGQEGVGHREALESSACEPAIQIARHGPAGQASIPSRLLNQPAHRLLPAHAQVGAGEHLGAAATGCGGEVGRVREHVSSLSSGYSKVLLSHALRQADGSRRARSGNWQQPCPLMHPPTACSGAAVASELAVPLVAAASQGTGRQARPMMPLPCWQVGGCWGGRWERGGEKIPTMQATPVHHALHCIPAAAPPCPPAPTNTRALTWGASFLKAPSLRSKCTRPASPQHHFCRRAMLGENKGC